MLLNEAGRVVWGLCGKITVNLLSKYIAFVHTSHYTWIYIDIYKYTNELIYVTNKAEYL